MPARFIPKFRIPRAITNMPETKIAMKWAEYGFLQLPKVVSWGLPGAILAAWLVYPALTPAFKNRLAFKDNIEPAILTYIEDEDVSQPPTLA